MPNSKILHFPPYDEAKESWVIGAVQSLYSQGKVPEQLKMPFTAAVAEHLEDAEHNNLYVLIEDDDPEKFAVINLAFEETSHHIAGAGAVVLSSLNCGVSASSMRKLFRHVCDISKSSGMNWISYCNRVGVYTYQFKYFPLWQYKPWGYRGGKHGKES